LAQARGLGHFLLTLVESKEVLGTQLNCRSHMVSLAISLNKSSQSTPSILGCWKFAGYSFFWYL